jgi:nitrite reductase (NADH) small subunit
MTVFRVARAEDVPPGTHVVVEVEGRSVGVYNSHGRFFALRNRCPHQGAPLCEGSFTGTLLPSEPDELRYGMHERVVMCPWHHWEFDVETGRALFDEQVRTKTYTVSVEAGEVLLHV